VAPFDVNNFMPQDAGDLGSGFGLFNEPREKENRSAGDRKSVELGILDDKESVVEGLRTHSGQYALSNAVDIAFNLRVGDEFELLAGLASKFAADPDFFVFARAAYGGNNVFRYLLGGAAATHQKTHQQEPGGSD
jgi:hypothetical protein